MEVYVVPQDEMDIWKDAAAPVRDVFVKNAGDLGKELLDLVD